jgi:integrase
MLSQIHPFLIEKHKQARVESGHRVAINRELAALSTLFGRAIEWNAFEGSNPVKVGRVRKLKEELNRLRFLSEEEECRLLETSSEPYRTIYLLGIYAGLRIRAEALTLKWENVDFERKQITIEAAYAKSGDTQTVPWHSRLVEPLKALFESRRNEWVFPRPEGRPIRSIREAFTNACQRAKLSGVTPHTLRHIFASRLGMAGINNLALQKLGRWKEPKMILRYAHLSEEHLADAIEKIGSGVPTRNLVSL